MATYRYFAYGSNMATERLRGRAPSARPLGRGRLLDHRLRWHKLGKDGSGKCDVAFTGAGSAHAVWGVVFEIDVAEKPLLDAAEGLGIGYAEQRVSIIVAGGECSALTYQAMPDKLDKALRPRPWYKDYVLHGAREHGLPADYILELAKVEVAG